MKNGYSIDLRRLFEGFFDSIGRKLTADGLRFWIAAFADLTPEQVQTALIRFGRESTDFPSPAAVRQYAGVAGLTSEKLKADAAWQVVRAHISRSGAYLSVEFDDPAINAAIRAIGGWVSLCDTLTSELHWKEKEFRRAYEAICVSQTGDGSPHHGLFAVENVKNGFGPDKPRRIRTGLAPARLTNPAIEEQPQKHVAGLIEQTAGRLACDHSLLSPEPENQDDV